MLVCQYPGIAAATLAIGVGSVMATRSAASEELPTRTLEVYRVATPPVLDGERNDPCWQDATPTGDWVLYQNKGVPKNRTRAWVCYDATSLYLFVECSDRDMAKVVDKRPQDKLDESIWQEEEIEIFFDVNHDRKTYYQLMCSVLGTKYDMASGVGLAWHGGRDRPGCGWRAKTTRDDQAWYAELAVPFTVLRRTTELAATPQPGTVWGANFYRHEYRENEWINWNVATRGFHQPSRFGELRFMGLRDRPLPSVEKVDLGELDFGRHVVPCRVKNPLEAPIAINASMTVAKRGNPTAQPIQRTARVAPGRSATLQFPYAIFDGGEWEASVAIKAGDDLLLVGQAARRLPQVRRDLARLLEAGQTGLAVVKASQCPAAVSAGLLKRLDALKAEAEKCGAQLKAPEALSPSQWDEVRGAVTKLKADSKETVRQLAYLKADGERRGDGARAGFLVGIHGPLEHVFTNTTTGAKPSSPVRLTAMGREGESFQVAVMARWDDLKGVRLSTEPLRGPGGVLDGEDLEVSLVAYQKSQRRPTDAPDTREWYPDVLLPNTPRDIPAYMTQPYWIDVYVPADTRPGVYTGGISVTAAGSGSLRVPVELTVRDHTLPKAALLRSDFWISTHGPRWWKYDTLSIDKMEEVFRIAQRNRVSAMPSFWIELYRKVKITRVGPDEHTFDFSEFNPYLLKAKEYGVNSWNANLECNQGWASYFCGGYGSIVIHDAHTGEEVEFANRYKKKTIPLRELWTETPIFEQFWKAYVANLKQIGMLDTALYESVDEPNDTPRIELLILIYGQLRKWVPELKLISHGTYPAHHYARARGYVDAWSPQLGWYWDVKEIMTRDQRDNGIMPYLYTCGSQARNGKGGYTPDGFVCQPNITRRIIPWMCYKWSIRGYLFFAMNHWPHRTEKDSIIPPEKQPWPTVTQVQKRPVFSLVMPGPSETFLPTIRLKAFRDGLEDHDYLKTLARLATEAQRVRAPKALLDRATRAVHIDDRIVHDPCTYTLDPQVLRHRRQQVGDLIEELSRALRAGR